MIMNSQHYIYRHTHAHINGSVPYMYVLGRWMRKMILTKFFVGWRNSIQTDEFRDFP